MRYLGIDNGVTGTIAVLDETGKYIRHAPTPTKKELSYTKAKQYITRIDVLKLIEYIAWDFGTAEEYRAIIERPMINPQRWKPTVSAIRALEATLVVLEQLNIPYRYIDSREWQKALLPKGLQKEELKKAAVDVARRLFPSVRTKDADGLLIAEYGRRTWI
jgi:hypothetical protein